MGRIDLQIKCNMENLNAIKCPPDADWHFKVKCTSCNEVHDNVIYFNLTEKCDMPNSRGEASFIQKCRLCERTGSIEYVDGSVKTYTVNSNEKWATICSFECRGIEPVEFMPADNFLAQSGVSEAIFGKNGEGEEPVDLAEGDWAGYDEEAEESIGIYEFKSQFVASKK